MIHTELIRLVEAALVGDTKRVVDYAKLLSDRFKEDGDQDGSRMLMKALSRSNHGMVTLDELGPIPVDQESRMTIADVGLPSFAKEQLVLSPAVQRKLNDFLMSIQHREELSRHHVDSPASLLLYGPPGCGKTTLAKYVAYKLGVPIITARFDTLISPLLGNTSKNIRKIFDHAAGKRCILFLDEFDAIGKARDDKYELGELKRVINSLLQNIDQFAETGILIAATNHAELLDRAIWRRFTTIIELPPADGDEALELISRYLENYEIAGLTPKRREHLKILLTGFSHAAVKSICQSCVRRAVLEGNQDISYGDLVRSVLEHSSHGGLSDHQLTAKMKEHDVSQRMITETLKISRRQTR
jgi:SpoVK/Ycf46/Vps4 family AAA+-type ATPase